MVSYDAVSMNIDSNWIVGVVCQLIKRQEERNKLLIKR